MNTVHLLAEVCKVSGTWRLLVFGCDANGVDLWRETDEAKVRMAWWACTRAAEGLEACLARQRREEEEAMVRWWMKLSKMKRRPRRLERNHGAGGDVDSISLPPPR
jgi:hypothetical protein